MEIEMSSKILSILISCFIIFSLAYSNVLAATFFVDQNNPSASDTNPGTESLPWLTLTKAATANVVVAGDTVIVKAGRYIDTNPNSTYENVFTPINSGTSDLPITFRSQPQFAAVLVSSTVGSTPNMMPAMAIKGRSYIVIDGFKVEGMLMLRSGHHNTIQNCDVQFGGISGGDPSLNWGIAIHTSSYCLARNNYIHEMLDSGNRTHNTAALMLFQSSNNIIEYNTADAGYGIVYSAFGQKGGSINNNVWRNNVAIKCPTGFLGMGSTDGSTFSDYNIFNNNLVLDCVGNYGSAQNTAFELDHNSRYWQIFNNTAFNCKSFIKSLNNTNVANQVWNNISYGNNTNKAIYNGGYPIAEPASVIFAYLNYNNFYNHTNWYYREKSPTLNYTLPIFQTSEGFDDKSLNSDPLFVNAPAGNFHLLPGSPAMGSGKDGNTMGAFQTEGGLVGHKWSVAPKPSYPLNVRPL